MFINDKRKKDILNRCDFKKILWEIENKFLRNKTSKELIIARI